MFSVFSARFSGRMAALLLLVSTALPGLVLGDVAEEQKLTPTAVSGALAGGSSSIFGSTAVVGAKNDDGDGCTAGAGAAYVYTRAPMTTVWTKVATLCASDGVDGDLFGASVSINAGNIAVGAPGRDSARGAVYVFSGGGSTWTENGTILSAGASAGGGLGSAVSIQGFTVAAGAPNTFVNSPHGGSDVGVTIVYTSNDGGVNWTNTTFRPNGGQARNGALFGSAVSLSGSTILVGAPGFRTGQKQNSGAVFVFVNSGSIWTQQARIRPANVENVFTGASVSLFQDKGAFGAPGAGSNAGAVYVYNRSGTTWSSQGTVNGAAGSQLGTSVSLQGSPFTVLAAGAPQANSQGGRAFEYGSSGGAFSLLNELLPSDNDPGDVFGSSAKLDAGRVIVGAPAKGPGAAYIFKVRSASTTTITGIVDDTHFDEDSLTGVPYDVFVSVTDPDVAATPTGSVHFDDSNGGSCDAALSESVLGTATGSCTLTSSFFGSLTMNASYGGDLSFAASSDSVAHTVTGNHFVFDPAPSNVLQGTKETGVVVKLLNGADELIDDSTTQVTVTANDTCGESGTPIGTLTLTNGMADFSGMGPNFYTVTSNGALNYTAQESPFDAMTSPASATSGNFDVDADSDIAYADGFEDCRL
jgi:FG-GAP repeat